jgi:hypothetical protein
MRKIKKSVFVSFIGIALFLNTPLMANPEEPSIKAKVGILIKSGEKEHRAKAKDDLKPLDSLRIYVLPDRESYIYVIHSDLQVATLLNYGQYKRPNTSATVLPSKKDFYQVDGKSSFETFTIICSPIKQSDVSDLFTSDKVPHSKWAILNTKLREMSRIDLSERSNKPFTLLGNVRALESSRINDLFVKELPIYSGKSILVKKYEFRVKK